MKQLDLNLLVIFDAIMTEGSISGASESLNMTQPAVSNAVSRMRQAFNDPLFVKEGRGIKPTTQALSLWNQISKPLLDIRNSVSPQEFDPATARRTFRIAAADIMVDMVWSPLRKLIESEAPHIDIHTVPYTPQKAQRLLADGEADLIIGISDDMRSADRKQLLFYGDYLSAMGRHNPLAQQELTLERYLQADHLLVSLSGDATGTVDHELSKMNLSRRVAMTVNNFSSVPALLRETNLISVVASTVVAKAAMTGELFVTRCPVEISESQVAIGWHARHDRDAGVKWLKDKVAHYSIAEWEKYRPECCKKTCAEMSEQHYA